MEFCSTPLAALTDSAEKKLQTDERLKAAPLVDMGNLDFDAWLLLKPHPTIENVTTATLTMSFFGDAAFDNGANSSQKSPKSPTRSMSSSQERSARVSRGKSSGTLRSKLPIPNRTALSRLSTTRRMKGMLQTIRPDHPHLFKKYKKLFDEIMFASLDSLRLKFFRPDEVDIARLSNFSDRVQAELQLTQLDTTTPAEKDFCKRDGRLHL